MLLTFESNQTKRSDTYGEMGRDAEGCEDAAARTVRDGEGGEGYGVDESPAAPNLRSGQAPGVAGARLQPYLGFVCSCGWRLFIRQRHLSPFALLF